MRHREMVYDHQTSNRRFKHFMRQSQPGHQLEMANFWGEHAVLNPNECPTRYRTNPYPPGKRHDVYERAAKGAREEIARWAEDQRRDRRRYPF